MRKLFAAIVMTGVLALGMSAQAAKENKGSSVQQEEPGMGGSGQQPGMMPQQAGSSTIVGKLQNADTDNKAVTLQVQVAENAKVMRNGQTLSLAQVKEGDEVRASFDPARQQVTALDVKPEASDQKKSDSPSAQPGVGGSGSQSAVLGQVKDVNENQRTLNMQLRLSPDAQILRDGKTASLDQLKEGDQIRASFDSTCQQINTLTATSERNQQQQQQQRQ